MTRKDPKLLARLSRIEGQVRGVAGGAGAAEGIVERDRQVQVLLDLVDHDGGTVLGEKAARVRAGKLADVGRLQRDVGMAGKGRTAKRGLAGLPGTGDGHHREVARR